MESLQDLVNLPAHERQARGLVYTPAEIAQQPNTWLETLSLFEANHERICAFLEGSGVCNSAIERPVVMLVGAGTSDYIGRALALLLRSAWGCEVFACASTELLPNMDAYVLPDRRYLWISFSRSGDSPEGIAAIEQAVEQHPRIAHLVVTCNAAGRMAAAVNRAAQGCVVVLADTVNDRSLAMTSSFTNMVVMGHCLAHAWSVDTYRPILSQLQSAARSLLVHGYPVARRLARARNPQLCFVGSGSLAAVATESALKVLEMSAGQVRTVAESTLGLRHGPMAALDAETLFICFVPGEEARQGYAADLLMEVGAKRVAARRIAVGPQRARERMVAACEEYVGLEAELPDMYRPPLDVIFGQMLGLCVSIERGARPDSPSPAGVIERVVQDFTIYR